MIYLILGIFANAFIFLAFRAFSLFKIDNLQAIVINYIVCVITGILYTGTPTVLMDIDYFSPLGFLSFIMGFLLIGGFYTASLTSQQIGVSVVSVASKMSMIIPILFSLFFMRIESKDFSILNYCGMFLAIFSIYLASTKTTVINRAPVKKSHFILLPFAVFLFGGAIDTIINFSNHKYLIPSTQEVFPIILFGFAAVIGIVFLVFKKEKLKLKNAIAGICLGIPNFFALLLIFKALTVFQNNGAVFFPIYNVGIILVSTIFAILIFREKLSKINCLGLGLSFLALFLLSHQEIIEYFIS